MRTTQDVLAVLSALAVLALSACASSRPGVRSPDRVGDGAGPPPLETNAGAVEGLVTAVDRDAGTVSLAAGDTIRVVPLAAEATVRIDDFHASFEDVREGQAVRAALHDTGERVEAVRIQILNQAVPVETEAGGDPREPATSDGAPRDPPPGSPAG